MNAPPPAGESATTAITNHMVRLAREGGAEHIRFLLALRASETHSLPKTFKNVTKLQADSKKRWLESCLEELKSLKDRDVYKIMDLPKGRKVVKNHWVFNIKPDGCYRSCLVAKGFSQVKGIDFDELFSPVVCYETARLLLAIAALEDLDIQSVDIKTAYLYGDLDEEIYMEQPESFKLPGKENKVWRLCKALYGLKQAGLSWWCTMTNSMLALRFKRCKSNAGIYYYHDKKTKALVIAIVYVDDVCFMGTKGFLLLNELKQKFMAR